MVEDSKIPIALQSKKYNLFIDGKLIKPQTVIKINNISEIIDAEKEQQINKLYNEVEKNLLEAIRQINIARANFSDIRKLREKHGG